MSDDEEMDEDDGFFVPHGYLSSDEENPLPEGKTIFPTIPRPSSRSKYSHLSPTLSGFDILNDQKKKRKFRNSSLIPDRKIKIQNLRYTLVKFWNL